MSFINLIKLVIKLWKNIFYFNKNDTINSCIYFINIYKNNFNSHLSFSAAHALVRINFSVSHLIANTMQLLYKNNYLLAFPWISSMCTTPIQHLKIAQFVALCLPLRKFLRYKYQLLIVTHLSLEMKFYPPSYYSPLTLPILHCTFQETTRYNFHLKIAFLLKTNFL